MYTREDVIKLAREVHGDKYDYSITESVKNKVGKIRYKCKIHNYIHEQTLHNHLQGKGCPLCAEEKRIENRKITKEEFIKRASVNRDDLDKYDFDKTDFSFRDELGRMEIYCKEHGRFLIRPNHFINGVEGCKFCNGRKKDDDEMRNELKIIHPNLDFSQSCYSEKDKNGNIKVICPKHGVKYMRYWNLIHGEGCYECSMREFGLKRRLTNEEIIKRGNEVYGEGVYTYEHLDNTNRTKDNKVIVTCPKHGDFSVNLSNFITGKSGCPVCRHSKMEIIVANKLKENNITFETQKTFDWLKYKSNLFLDFYLPDYGIAIECQGVQHFIQMESNVSESLSVIQKRDIQKKKLCEENSVKILYYMSKDFVKEDTDFYKIEEIISYIKNNAQN